MAYRLPLDDIPAALRACGAEQLDDAVRLLRDEREADPVEAVHGARKDLKKTRALLRLARPDMPRKAYRRENRALRDTARSISAARDADVMVETVDKLSERFVGQLPATAFAARRDQLAAEARSSRARADAAISGEVIHALEAASARAAAWPVEHAGPATLRAGARRAYRRGRKAFAAADAEPSVERRHEWRKRVKDLWYHARLLEDAWPGPLRAQADEAHSLSDVLGDDHDLAMLAERLAAAGDAAAPPDDDVLLELVARRRAELLDEARRLGRRLYAEKPSAYGRRLGGYVKAATSEHRVAEPA